MRLIGYDWQGHRYFEPLRTPTRARHADRVFVDPLAIRRNGKPVFRQSDPVIDHLTQKVVAGPELDEGDRMVQQRVVVALEGAELAAAQEAFDTFKTSAKAKVDGLAEECRQNYVTPGDAQQAVYQLKKAEAEAMASDGNPQVANYPLLAQEVGITAGTLPAVGVSVRAQAAAWIAVAATIEGLRLGAKQTIDNATTYAAVEAAATGITWPAPE